MARAIADEVNGRAVVLIDVDQYGGDRLSIKQAIALSADLSNAIKDAKRNRDRIQGDIR